MKPRRLSPRYLENAALFHLRRHSSTVLGLKRVLLRKVDRSLRFHGGDREEAVGWIEALLPKLQRSGYLDDERFATSRARSLLQRGTSVRMIQQRLKLKGVSAALVASSVQGLKQEDASPDWVAAVAYARRRRLGPFRKRPLAAREDRARELASFARSGFSYTLASRIVDAPDEASLDG